jgi:predicted RNase H-like HicB family nuclease
MPSTAGLIWINEPFFEHSHRSTKGVPMTDASYYSLIERAEDGRFVAWVPDLPEITITGDTEEEVIRALSLTVRQSVREMIINGIPVPLARPVDELPRGSAKRQVHRLLLLIG